MTLIESLVRKGIIPTEQAREFASQLSSDPTIDTERFLINAGIDEVEILKTKSELYGIPYKVLDSKSVQIKALKYIPEEAARHYGFVPIGLQDGVLDVGIIDPQHMQSADALQFISVKENVAFKIFLVTHSFFDAVLNGYAGITEQVGQALEDYSSDAGAPIVDPLQKKDDFVSTATSKETIVEDAPIIKIVDVIISHATDGNASDIHIENTGDKVKVRFRVDGVMYTSLVLPANVFNGIVARIKILSNLLIDEKRKPQDGSFSRVVDGKTIDFRVSTLPTYYGEKVVIRILDTEKGVRPITEIGLGEVHLDLIKRALEKPYGLILITGPTGSGKTTTLYSMLNQIDREKRNVVSLEDPVEYHIPGLNQSQVMPSIGYTFATGLRSILRQDPDIIMVGEIRDKETAQLAIQAALTGHLVLSTLHTNTALGAIPRLVDMGVDPYLIAPTLTLTIAQRLVRTICPGATKTHEMDETTKKMIDVQFADLPEEFRSKLPLGDVMHEITPTPECPSGLRGRMSVFEMVEIDADLQNAILHNPVEAELYKIARKKGMLTMREDAMIKALEGKVPMTEVHTFL